MINFRDEKNVKKCWNCVRLGVCEKNQIFNNNGCSDFLNYNDVIISSLKISNMFEISNRTHLRHVEYIKQALVSLEKKYNQKFFIMLDKDGDLQFIDSRLYGRYCDETI